MEMKDTLTIAVAVGGLAVGLLQYRKTSRDQFLDPIRQAQLDLYRQASSAASKLSTLPPKEAEWNAARNDFLRLYYGPLAMVESYRHRPAGGQQNPTVEQAMIAFKGCLDDPACVGSDTMRNLSLALAHTCRISVGATWGVQAAQLEGDYQRLIGQYQANRKSNPSP